MAANLGLALQNNYASLMVLRCLQSSSSGGTVALGQAVMDDLITSEERGRYMAYLTLGLVMGPALGPVSRKSLHCHTFKKLTITPLAHRWIAFAVSRLESNLLVSHDSRRLLLPHGVDLLPRNESVNRRRRIGPASEVES